MSELNVSSFYFKINNLEIYNNCALICLELQCCNQFLQGAAIFRNPVILQTTFLKTCNI